MTSKQRHTFEDRYVLAIGRPWLGGDVTAGILTKDGRAKRLKRPPAVDRHSFWDRPQYRLILERVK